MGLGNGVEIGLRREPAAELVETGVTRRTLLHGLQAFNQEDHEQAFIERVPLELRRVGKTTSAVQLEKLRNRRRARSILHYPRACQLSVGVLRLVLNIGVRLFWVSFAALKACNSTGRVPTKACV